MQQRLVRFLYQEVNISPEEVEYIEAHGTGTKVSFYSSFIQDETKEIAHQNILSSGLENGHVVSLHVGGRPAGGKRHRWCVLSIQTGSSAHGFHKVEHGSSRTGFRSGCHGEGEGCTVCAPDFFLQPNLDVSCCFSEDKWGQNVFIPACLNLSVADKVVG